jgi:phage virion morphogenesis protein
MTGVTFEARFDDADLSGALARLAAGAADPSPLMRIIGDYGVDSTRRRMIEQHAPDGTAWAALNPAYAELKGSGYDILYASGALRGSLTYLAGMSEVSWGSGMIYAAVHQFGATIVPKNAPALSFVLGGKLSPYLVSVKSVTIPARPYLGISDADRVEIELLGREYLTRLWDGV